MSGGVGWGAGPWGSSPFGGPTPGLLQLQSAVASRENAVQLTFSLPVYYSGLLDPNDASVAARFGVQPVPGTVGLDGEEARDVAPAFVAIVDAPGFAFGQVLELTLDRPMTASPSRYVAVCAGLLSADRTTPLDPTAATIEFVGCRKVISRASREQPDLATRDFANAQSAVLGPGGVPILLGVPPVDDTRDYGYDAGIVGYKKRILRRIVTRPGGFAHLGVDYGVGVADYGKRLASPAHRQQLITRTEQQVLREPETAKVRVLLQQLAGALGAYRMSVLARTRAGTGLRLDLTLPG